MTMLLTGATGVLYSFSPQRVFVCDSPGYACMVVHFQSPGWMSLCRSPLALPHRAEQ